MNAGPRKVFLHDGRPKQGQEVCSCGTKFLPDSFFCLRCGTKRLFETKLPERPERPERPQMQRSSGLKYTGLVKSYNRKGFGFILCPNLEADLYFSRDSICPSLQTSDLAGEQVTFEVRRFPDGKLQAHNLRPVGDVSCYANSSGVVNNQKGAGSYGAGSYGAGGKGGRDEEDRSRDWCKAGRKDGAMAVLPPKPPPPPKRRGLSPHAGSRAMRDMLRARAAARSPSRKRRRKSSSSSKSRGRRKRSRSKRRNGQRSSSRGQKADKRSEAKSSSSSSSSSSDAADDTVAAESAPGAAEGLAADASAATSPEIETAKAEALEKLLQIKGLDKEQRMSEWRALLRQWHPDKNPERVEVATAVFQFLQKGKMLLDADKS